MPPPVGFNPALFLYINPEVAAACNGVEDLLAQWDQNAVAWGALPIALPLSGFPQGFDPRVYLATRSDVSGLNAAVHAAMVREGTAAGAVYAQSQFVATLGSARAQLVAPNEFQVRDARLALSDCNLRVGDRVRVLRPRMGHVEGDVVSVTPPSSFVLSNACYAVEESDPARPYELFGIRIADPVRQGFAALARTPPAELGTTSFDVATGGSNTVVVDGTYEPDTYRTLYPDARAMSYEDAYLDHVGRWSRGDSYRALRGSDLVNRLAPKVALCNLTVDTLGVGMPYPDFAATGTRVAVDGDVFTTGTVVTQSDERAKSGLERIDRPMDRVHMLTGYTYEAKAAPSRRHVGLLAQDVLRAMPEAVYDGAPGLRSVAYGNLAGLFTEALKEVAARVEKLERQPQPMHRNGIDGLDCVNGLDGPNPRAAAASPPQPAAASAAPA